MKHLFATLGLFALLAIPAQGAFAWTYNGLGSLNPFTNFGRNGDPDCGCQKVERCQKAEPTCCERTHRYVIQHGQPCGCAAPVKVYNYDYVPTPKCSSCQRAFR